MSDRPSNVPATNKQKSLETPKPGTSSLSNSDKYKLTLSQSENTLDSQKTGRQKPLAKVKSWSSKDCHSAEQTYNVELDLARSLTKLEVAESNEDFGTVNLLRARDSLSNMVKDEQNTPKSGLETIFQTKLRNGPDSPKSSPQLGKNSKDLSSKQPFWNSYDRPGKKNRKDIKNHKKSHLDWPKSAAKKSSMDESGKCEDSNKNAVEESSDMEEEHTKKFKYMAKNSKSVVFTNEVLVVYFNNDDVVGEEKEPLKKEVEQQTRNQEMRRVHLNKTQEKYNLCLF
ncbi:hypothetical protein ABEB36_010044 [Hypothenemus hampei]|uniref:Uncharacterized protein n=1 Tax=Hypothenemus hampei TaxID=57062 RepID=A0ABD1EIU0_HYPHA